MVYSNGNELQLMKRKFKTDMTNKNVDLQEMYEYNFIVGAPVLPHSLS